VFSFAFIARPIGTVVFMKIQRRFGREAKLTIALFLLGVSTAGILITQCLFALGMGLTIAPATASIMGAVSSARAGVGSAINDTTRQVGGALGVAVMGSVGASLYRHSINGSAAAAHLPHAALDSVGSTLKAASQLPAGTRTSVVEAAQRAFIHGLDIASLVGVFVALVGAAIAVRYLPAAMKVGAPAAAPDLTGGTDRDTTGVLVPALSLNTEVDL